MASLKEQRATYLKDAQSIVESARGRDLTTSETSQLESLVSSIKSVDESIARSAKATALIGNIGKLDDEQELDGGTGSFLALSGKAGKSAASQLARQIIADTPTGAKALVGTGSITTNVPLTSTDPIESGRIPTFILDVLPVTRHNTPSYRYLRQSVRTNNAAIVAPGATKPTSVYTVAPVDGSLQVFAHISEPVDYYLLQDNDALARFLTDEMYYGLAQAIETEIINGAGTTGHLTGILNTSGIQTQAAGADKIVTLRSGITKLETLGYDASAIVINPLDWEEIETTRAGTSGSFDLGGPVDRAARRVWGTQVITSAQVSAGTALAFDRTAVGVDTDTLGIQTRWDSSGTLFEKNQTRVLVEGRFGVSVYKPSAVVEITLPAAA